MLNELLDALAYAGETLDKPGAAVRGLAAGRPDQLLNLVPFSDAIGLTDPSQRVSGRDLLQQYGMLGENTPGLDFGDVAGFAVEEGLDPVNWIPGGFVAKRILKHTGELPTLTRMFGKTAPVGRWGDDLAGWEAKLADQEVDEIYQDWLFDKRRLESIPPAYQFPSSGSVFTPEEVGGLMTDYNARAYQRRFGAAGEPVGPEELEPLYRALHGKRLGRYRDWLQQNAVLDETGQPAKLYHGTGNAFEDFDPEMFGLGSGGNLAGTGVYLSNNPRVSSDYAMSAWRKGGLFNDPPANVRMQHAIGPVADVTTPVGIEATHGLVRKPLPGPDWNITANADEMYRSKLLYDLENEHQNLFPDVDATDVQLFGYESNPNTTGMMPIWQDSSQVLNRMVMGDMRKRIPDNGIDYLQEMQRWLEDYYFDSPVSLGSAMPGVTGIKHPGGLATGGQHTYDAYVMFDPKNVVPVNPSPGMLQILAERFKDPATGALPFSMLAALGLGGAMSQGGQQGVH